LRIDAARNMDLDEWDMMCVVVCIIHDMTGEELEQKPPEVIANLIDRAGKLFAHPTDDESFDTIGFYRIIYNPSKLTLGQYVEIKFFGQQKIAHAHYYLASITKKIIGKSEHKDRAEFFHKQPVHKVLGSLKRFHEELRKLEAEYGSLYNLDPEVHAVPTGGDKFNLRHGWTFSATKVAEHERITLDEAYKLPIRQALNDLVFIKEKDKYEANLIKQNTNGR